MAQKLNKYAKTTRLIGKFIVISFGGSGCEVGPFFNQNVKITNLSYQTANQQLF